MRILPLLALVATLSCAGSTPEPAAPKVKTGLRAVDEALKLACMGLAQQLAQHGSSDVRAIVNQSCALESFTRSIREILLSEQIRAAEEAGVAVAHVNSGAFEDQPVRPPEAAAE